MIKGKLKKILSRASAAAIAAALIMCGSTAFAVDGISQPRLLVPLGYTAGVRMFADGVMVVGVSGIACGGVEVSPAREAGIEIGDRIIEINSQKPESAEQLREIIGNSDEVDLKIERGGKTVELTVKTVRSDADGERKLGAWVRDSLAGIGTLTYYDKENGEFGALGHGVTDTDTKTLMPMSGGSLVRSSVVSVRKGTAGCPGELQGEFDLKGIYGCLEANTECGLFGTVKARDLDLSRGEMPVATIAEIKEGDAVILSSVSGCEVREYDVKILRVYADGSKSPRDMLIEVTDPDLIAATGGIVQGMSGSPILQDGKLVGAVTHVLVNDPTRGYGIFIENMLEAAG